MRLPRCRRQSRKARRPAPALLPHAIVCPERVPLLGPFYPGKSIARRTCPILRTHASCRASTTKEPIGLAPPPVFASIRNSGCVTDHRLLTRLPGAQILLRRLDLHAELLRCPSWPVGIA